MRVGQSPYRSSSRLPNENDCDKLTFHNDSSCHTVCLQMMASADCNGWSGGTDFADTVSYPEESGCRGFEFVTNSNAYITQSGLVELVRSFRMPRISRQPKPTNPFGAHSWR